MPWIWIFGWFTKTTYDFWSHRICNNAVCVSSVILRWNSWRISICRAQCHTGRMKTETAKGTCTEPQFRLFKSLTIWIFFPLLWRIRFAAVVSERFSYRNCSVNCVLDNSWELSSRTSKTMNGKELCVIRSSSRTENERDIERHENVQSYKRFKIDGPIAFKFLNCKFNRSVGMILVRLPISKSLSLQFRSCVCVYTLFVYLLMTM